MVAPIDARASVQAGDETIALQLNMRTLALAKAGGVNLLKLSLTEIDPLDMAIVIEAFAKPEQPDFDAEQAFATIVRYPTQCRDALAALSAAFAAVAEGAVSTHPPKPARKRRSSTS